MRITRQDETPKSILPQRISLVFPETKYQDLVKTLGLEEVQNLNSTQQQLIFVNAIYMFLTGEWSQDELSTVANRFWGGREDLFDDLGTALYNCAELSFYIRNIYNPGNPQERGNFDDFMVSTISFYEAHFELVHSKIASRK